MICRVTALTPLLVGDGRRLSPIDYMVWKDQVNVLDQNRIFKLLSRGPRLDGYLAQIKKAEKLDFASWGGFAQNFADRRIPFEYPGAAVYWEKLRGEQAFIPTFNAGPSGPYLPGSALRGALRTALLFSRWTEATTRSVMTKFEGDRGPRNPGQPAEDQAIGNGRNSRMKTTQVGDSTEILPSVMKIYLLRVATLESRGQGTFELGWKLSTRGSVNARRVEESTPLFAEMAPAGTSFQCNWNERGFYKQPDVAKSLDWREGPATTQLFEAANRFSSHLVALNKRYAQMAGLTLLSQSIQSIETAVQEAASRGACVVPIGWGGGLLTKIAAPEPDGESYRQIVRQIPLYSRAIQSGLPFPKTRRIVFIGNQPAALPGWCMVELVNSADH
jgi:CRISPR-associated protein Csm5